MSTTKRLRAPLIVMLGVLMAMVAYAAPANAAGYSDQTTTSVSDQTPTAGSQITFCGKGFLPREKVSIVLDQGLHGRAHAVRYRSVRASSSGEFCTTIRLGLGLRGTHTLTASGKKSKRSSTTTIDVQAPVASGANSGFPTRAAGTGELAFTGANAIGIGALGGLLLLGGAAMVLVGRRRKVHA